MRQAGIAQGGADGYSLFIVEKGMEGFRLGQQLKGKCGMRGSATAELVFEQVSFAMWRERSRPPQSQSPVLQRSTPATQRRRVLLCRLLLLNLRPLRKTRAHALSLSLYLPRSQVRVPAANLVGAEGGAVRCMMRNLEIERLCLAAMSCGIARRCVEVTASEEDARACTHAHARDPRRWQPTSDSMVFTFG